MIIDISGLERHNYGLFQQAFLARFPDDDACWARLETVRWPNGPICPRCTSVDNAHLVGRAHYRRCNACRAKFKATHGTPLQGTHLPLRTCFVALCLMETASAREGRHHSKGISSVELAERLGIGQKTAWLLRERLHRMADEQPCLVQSIMGAP